MIDGMRMDLVKSRYRTYDELYGYCYKVAGTVALMTTPVMGIDPGYPVRAAAHPSWHMDARDHTCERIGLHACRVSATSSKCIKIGSGEAGQCDRHLTLSRKACER